jgi:hypothetical protein
MRYFFGKLGFMLAMTANDDFYPQRFIREHLSLDECAYLIREHELFLDIAGCLDANV